jgi:hypothetical protein
MQKKTIKCRPKIDKKIYSHQKLTKPQKYFFIILPLEKNLANNTRKFIFKLSFQLIASTKCYFLAFLKPFNRSNSLEPVFRGLKQNEMDGSLSSI